MSDGDSIVHLHDNLFDQQANDFLPFRNTQALGRLPYPAHEGFQRLFQLFGSLGH